MEGNYEQPSQGTSDDWHFVTISAKPGSDKVFQCERTSLSLFSIFILEQGVHLEEQGGDRVGVSPHQGGEGREGASVQGESVLELLS